MMKRMIKPVALACGTLALGGSMAFAGDGGEAAKTPDVMLTVNTLWILISAFLVFMMHLGFATLESGLTRSKNTVNILFKNTTIVAIGLLTYAAIGFGLMFPEGKMLVGKVLGFVGFGVDASRGAEAYPGLDITYWAFFIFQAMFAATAATIVSGAVAERVKLGAFLLFSAVYVAIIYPIVGMWIWGGGWLGEMGFHDFAGSTAVHSVGGWAALAGIMVLGARTGKYVNGKSKPIPGHSLPLAAIGVFLLWFGWYGFNGGSVLSADPGAVGLVFVTTSLGAAAGVAGAMMISWWFQHKPDLSMVLNGALAGLVGITAGADVISPLAAIIIGGIAGVVVVFAVLVIDTKLKLDDPVGATSVHLICGVWGTLATGIFGEGCSFKTQLIGVVVPGALCFVSAYVLFTILKLTLGIRVSEDEERRGLDIGEHGMEAYAGFQIFITQ
jgi:ammonium transporter, Amt family